MATLSPTSSPTSSEKLAAANKSVSEQLSTPNPTDPKVDSLFKSFLKVAIVALAVVGGASVVSNLGGRDMLQLGLTTIVGTAKTCMNLSMEYIITPGLSQLSIGAAKAGAFVSSFATPKAV